MLYFLLVSTCIGLIALLTIAAKTKQTQIIAAIVLPLLVLSGYFTYNGIQELRGKPTFIIPKNNRFFLITSFENKPKSIYLWLLPKGSNTPLYVEIPWSDEGSKKINKAKKDTEQGNIIEVFGFGNSTGFDTHEVDLSSELPKIQQ